MKDFCSFHERKGVILKLLTPAFPNENERFIHQLQIVGGGGKLNPSLDRFNYDWKKEENSTFEGNLDGSLAPWSTFLRVKTAIPCVLSLTFENRGE